MHLADLRGATVIICDMFAQRVQYVSVVYVVHVILHLLADSKAKSAQSRKVGIDLTDSAVRLQARQSYRTLTERAKTAGASLSLTVLSISQLVVTVSDAQPVAAVRSPKRLISKDC